MTITLVLLYLLLGRVLPWSLAVTAAIFWGRRDNLLPSLVLLFVLGMLEDAAHVQPFGLTSLLLVTIACVTWFIEGHYQGKLVWWWLALGVAGEAVFQLVQGKPVGFIALLGQFVTLATFHWILFRFRETEGIYVGK